MKVAVLYGGVSAERAVSLCSGARIAAALHEAGHAVTLLDVGDVPKPRELALMRDSGGVFLALHGGSGEDGRLQALLEQNGIDHYTGSPPHGAALAMNKEKAKACVGAAGVAVAQGIVLHGFCPMPPLPYPFVCKPLLGGSSVGLSFIYGIEGWKKQATSSHFEEGMLCEAYLSGREYTVGVLNGCALPAVEIRPTGGVYDYAHKYTAGATAELCPAPISREQSARLAADALRAFRALGLRDYARIDFREDGEGVPHFLEANTLPGMTETSLLPLAAKTWGIDFEKLCERMLLLAAARKKT